MHRLRCDPAPAASSQARFSRRFLAGEASFARHMVWIVKTLGATSRLSVSPCVFPCRTDRSNHADKGMALIWVSRGATVMRQLTHDDAMAPASPRENQARLGKAVSGLLRDQQ